MTDRSRASLPQGPRQVPRAKCALLTSSILPPNGFSPPPMPTQPPTSLIPYIARICAPHPDLECPVSLGNNPHRNREAVKSN